MPAYSLELVDRGGNSLGELPNAQLESVEWANSGIGNIAFTMKQDDPRIKDPVLRRHEVKLFIDGWPSQLEVPWQGPLLNDKQTDTQVEFSGSSIEWYLSKRYIDFSSLHYDDLPGGYDQVQIGWGLVQYAQGIPVRDCTITNLYKYFGVTAGTLPSSISRLRRYNREDHANILSLLSEFPTLVDFSTGLPNGFDWRIVPMVDGRRLWTAYTPQRGQLRADLTLEYGRNITEFTVTEDMVNYASRAICSGGSNGDIKMENEWQDALASIYYGEDLAITSDGDQLDVTELGAKARSYVQARNHPITDPQLSAVRAPVELLGVLQPGDTIPVSIHRGRTDMEGVYRIDKIKWAVRPNTLQLTFLPTLADTAV